MKIWELSKVQGKQYMDSDGVLWQVDKYGSLMDEDGSDISFHHQWYSMATLDFKLVVDWLSLDVDTPVMVSNDGLHWERAFFSRCDPERKLVYAFNNGGTQWSSKGYHTGWKQAGLLEGNAIAIGLGEEE